jgi:pimeloyl-ACP methyl ester carboxylesterase
VPVVAINPDHPPTDVEALRRHGVSTVLMSGVGHFGMLEDPETFNRVLTEIVATFTR